MKDENHKNCSLDVFRRYRDGLLDQETYLIGEFNDKSYKPNPNWGNCIYILRIGKNAERDISLANIPNSADRLGILYIGGHESGRIANRFIKLIQSARAAEKYFCEEGFAKNDGMGGHSVGGCLTTSILEAGFKIDDCVLDLVASGHNLGFDELELLIGYQETFHHLPPWNSIRGGASGYSIS